MESWEWTKQRNKPVGNPRPPPDWQVEWRNERTIEWMTSSFRVTHRAHEVPPGVKGRRYVLGSPHYQLVRWLCLSQSCLFCCRVALSGMRTDHVHPRQLWWVQSRLATPTVSCGQPISCKLLSLSLSLCLCSLSACSAGTYTSLPVRVVNFPRCGGHLDFGSGTLKKERLLLFWEKTNAILVQLKKLLVTEWRNEWEKKQFTNVRMIKKF